MTKDAQTSVLLSKVGNISTVGLLVVDLGANQTEYINGALIKILGEENADAIYYPQDLFAYTMADDADYIRSKISDLMRTHTVSNVELRLSVKDATVYVSCDAFLLKEENKAIVFVRDTTKLKEFENYIITYGAKKDTLLEMLSHNLSGPLNLSNQVINKLQQHPLTRESKDMETHVRFIKETTQHCIEFIYDFLKDEHLTSEKIFVKKNRFDVVKRINSVLAQYNHTYPDRNLLLETSLDTLFVNGDDMKLMQILNNFIANAIKFTPPDKPIDIYLESDGVTFSISVSDQGIGVPDKLKPYIFERDFAAGRTGLNGEPSLGIGLSVVKRLVELMKGEIKFESIENEGTTFMVTFPILGR